MDTLVGEFFIENNQLKSCKQNNLQFDSTSYKLYEVMRVIGGVVVFLEDHLERLKRGASTLGTYPDNLDEYISNLLSELIRNNQNRDGNIKLLCASQGESFRFAACYIPHKYPDPEDYKIGIRMMTETVTRPDPNLKQVSVSDAIRYKLGHFFNTGEIYEVLLISEKHLVTEGSRSNIFFIRDEKLFTAPDSLILKGITRKYVIRSAKMLGIECVQQDIHRNELSSFDAAFICGTSPMILPVREIDQHSLNVENESMRMLMRHYEETLKTYVNSRK